MFAQGCILLMRRSRQEVGEKAGEAAWGRGVWGIVMRHKEASLAPESSTKSLGGSEFLHF